jgi:hypothetical protein
MLFYVILAAVIYAVLADRTDRAADREMNERRPEASNLGLVEDFDVRPDLGPRFGRLLGHHTRPRPSKESAGVVTDRGNHPT